MAKRSNPDRAASLTSAGKTVRRTESINLYSKPPRWSFAKLDAYHSEWGVQPNSRLLAELLIRFQSWEASTWGEILTYTGGRRDNTQSHSIPVSLLCPEARARLRHLNLDSYDELYSLAITGRRRVWGIMIEETGTFQMLWYDANHAIYPLD